jgi:hypothetical protein
MRRISASVDQFAKIDCGPEVTAYEPLCDRRELRLCTSCGPRTALTQPSSGPIAGLTVRPGRRYSSRRRDQWVARPVVSVRCHASSSSRPASAPLRAVLLRDGGHQPGRIAPQPGRDNRIERRRHAGHIARFFRVPNTSSKGCAGGDPEVPFPCAARTSRQHRPGRRSPLVATLLPRRTVVAAPRYPRPARCRVVGSSTGPAGVAARAGAARGSVPGRGRDWACARHSERTEETCRTRTPWMAGAR